MAPVPSSCVRRLKVAVIGSGISGLSCAWLLDPRHEVTLYEAEPRLGGHTNTVDVPAAAGSVAASVAVDTGFIVYNEAAYPNLTAFFAHLGVATRATEMSFGVSLDHGALEYGSAHPLALLAQPSNALKPRFWSMMMDLVRFYREAPTALAALQLQPETLGQLLDRGGYGRAFQEDHLLPQVGAIWSSSAGQARDYPAAPLIRFFENHGLLKIMNRPQWRSVTGGSHSYVQAITRVFSGRIRRGETVRSVRRTAAGVLVRDAAGHEARYDHVVLATHADQALRLLSVATPDERRLLGAFRYSQNVAVLHTDISQMPRRRAAWSAWNHVGLRDEPNGFCVTYWMNELQGLPKTRDVFVTLNPRTEPDPVKVLGRFDYEHPLFDTASLEAQRQLWSLQGEGCVWFCGAHFGAGFHEDGLQSGLAVAEQLGGVRRPWTVQSESGRIHVTPLRERSQGVAA
ncbi:NAD(P)/FAD-dependent oxidoreductase [Caulobacter sp. S45]|uniref:NAD(P)/FAD-dependent oxidoreductase n=1 Tax=Caulobacter sp. S45 TaxID=1641861 RepID=UPI001577126A|nr:FAD-dependent oxidoreductase [Caulobacter sp. S45]